MVTCEDRVEKTKKFKVGDIHKQVKAPTAKPGDLSLKPKTHMVGEGNCFPPIVA